ncbi:MAG: nicotinamide riboside transporter PnuC [Cytophagales bacterium]|jgi:nicotinamide mononucleotide transporter|nr:nicotinamide riboside transporter PnuC [Cytophagales bacterium]
MFFFDIDHVFFTVFGYPMSYLEFFGVVTGAAGVWLASVAHVWTWPVGLVNVILSFFLFYQVQLYPDMFLQVFYCVTTVTGWWSWKHPEAHEADRKNELKVSYLTRRDWLLWLPAVAVAVLLLGAFSSRLHVFFPAVFAKPSAFPYLDSFTTIASIAATFWMIRKKIECWYAWILIDIVSTYMYYVKDVKFYSLLYLVFCFLAASGAVNWLRIYRKYTEVVSR